LPTESQHLYALAGRREEVALDLREGGKREAGGPIGLAGRTDPLVVRDDPARVDADPAGEPALDELVEKAFVLP
jgi:hypothetical protein